MEVDNLCNIEERVSENAAECVMHVHLLAVELCLMSELEDWLQELMQN